MGPAPICPGLRPVHRMTDRSGRVHSDTDPIRLSERVGKANEQIRTCEFMLIRTATCGLAIETKGA